MTCRAVCFVWSLAYSGIRPNSSVFCPTNLATSITVNVVSWVFFLSDFVASFCRFLLTFLCYFFSVYAPDAHKLNVEYIQYIFCNSRSKPLCRVRNCINQNQVQLRPPSVKTTIS